MRRNGIDYDRSMPRHPSQTYAQVTAPPHQGAQCLIMLFQLIHLVIGLFPTMIQLTTVHQIWLRLMINSLHAKETLIAAIFKNPSMTLIRVHLKDHVASHGTQTPVRSR